MVRNFFYSKSLMKFGLIMKKKGPAAGTAGPFYIVLITLTGQVLRESPAKQAEQPAPPEWGRSFPGECLAAVAAGQARSKA